MPITRQGQLVVPDASEIVGADEVQRLIAEADRELSRLEQEAATALAEAEALERDAGRLGADEASAGWALLHLRRYLESLQAETERHTAALIDIAEHRAHESVAMARAEIERGRLGMDSEERPSPSVPDAEPTSHDEVSAPLMLDEVPAPPRVVEPVGGSVLWKVDGAAAATSPDRSVPVDEPSAQADDPSVATAASLSIAPTRVVEAEHDLPASTNHTTTELRVVSPGAPKATNEVLGDPMAPEAAAPSPADGEVPKNDEEFWPGSEPEVRKRRLRRIPWSAVLQVTAVIALLVVILLRLS